MEIEKIKEEILIHIQGNISPETLGAGELGELLKNLEEAILPTAQLKNPKEKLSLIKLETGSLSLIFPLSDSLQFSIENLTESFITGNLKNLTNRCRSAVQWLSRWVKKNSLVIGFNIGQKSYGVLTAELNLRLENAPKVNGTTTITGILRSVGGEKPSLRIRLTTGELKTVTCTEELAKKAGKYIYRRIEVEGNAQTSILTGDSEYLEAKSVILLETKLTEGFKSIRERFGQTFNSVNPDDFVKTVRGEN